MIILIRDDSGTELWSNVTRLEDVTRENSALTQVVMFRGDDAIGPIDLTKGSRVELLPEDRG